VCPAHHDIRCKFGQQLGKQLTHSATQKAIALYLVSCLDNMSVLLKLTTVGNSRQMDLSGPSIDVKLKEKKEKKTQTSFSTNFDSKLNFILSFFFPERLLLLHILSLLVQLL